MVNFEEIKDTFEDVYKTPKDNLPQIIAIGLPFIVLSYFLYKKYDKAKKYATIMRRKAAKMRKRRY